jgi:hypothetical protein
MLDTGLVFASDSRTHAGVDNFASFCKMTVFERVGDRVLVLLSSGNLAGTQAVISVLKQRNTKDGEPNLWSAESMFNAAMLVSDAMRDVNRRDGQTLQAVVPASTPRSYLAARSLASRHAFSGSMRRATSSRQARRRPISRPGKPNTGDQLLIG